MDNFEKFLENLEHLNFLSKIQKSKAFSFLFPNLALALGALIYLLIRFNDVNTLVPFWYVKPWGEMQLAPKSLLFLIPSISAVFTLLGFMLYGYLKKHYFRYGPEILVAVLFGTNILLSYSLFRIVQLASQPFKPFIPVLYTDLATYALLAFGLVYVITPYFIRFATKHGIVTNPNYHDHPGMVLAQPSARGGGVVFAIGVLVVSMLFVKMTPQVSAIYIGIVLLAILGFLDDYQNTHPKSALKILEKPWLRLVLLFSIVSVLAYFDVLITFVNLPFAGLVTFDTYKVTLLGGTIAPVAILVTILWVVWIMNLLSWSNGIDGQYCGIVGIAAVVIALLALRFVPLEPYQQNIAKLAIIMAGASFGLTAFNWHPSKIMWGFGALTAGFGLSAVSIIIGSKIATSIIVILVPFLDALVTVLRRVLQGKNPLKGDRGHLHHLLLDKGWSVKQSALFYWVSTGVLGLVALLSSESVVFQTLLVLSGVIASVILIANFWKLPSRR